MKDLKIFDKMRLKGHTLSNRLVVAPMTRRSANKFGIPTPRMADYYGNFAGGGFGMIITEGTYTDTYYSQSDENQPGIVTDEQIMGWETVVDKVHREGSLIILQLMHAGALSQFHESTIAPSAIEPIGERSTEEGGLKGSFPMPGAMNHTDFLNVKSGFVHAACNAREAGFDGVEIHSANGYLFDQFLTEYTNVRTDDYGGSTRNRLRFLMEVFSAVKLVSDPDFIIGIRLSESKVNDLTYRWPKGSETATEVFSILNEIDPDYLHIAAEGGNWARESLYPDGLSSTGLAKSLTKSLVIANGGLHDIALAEKLIQTNQADLISIGRAALANSAWPNLIRDNQPIIPFFKELIKPSLTLEHSENALKRYYMNLPEVNLYTDKKEFPKVKKDS